MSEVVSNEMKEKKYYLELIFLFSQDTGLYSSWKCSQSNFMITGVKPLAVHLTVLLLNCMFFIWLMLTGKADHCNYHNKVNPLYFSILLTTLYSVDYRIVDYYTLWLLTSLYSLGLYFF